MDYLHFIALATEQAVENAPESVGLAGTLGLNGKLFLAQLVNFGIVIFVLWKWVFRPVVGALEQRREKIEKAVADAKAVEERVVAFEAQQTKDLKKARAQAESILKEATEVAHTVQQEALANTRKESELLLAQAKLSMQAEKSNMLREVREEIATLTVLATEKVLQRKLDEKSDHELIHKAIKSIKP